MQRASYKTHCDSLQLEGKKKKEKKKRERKRGKKMSPVYQRLPGPITSKILLCGFRWKCEKLLKHFSSCLEKKKKIFIERM